MRILIVSHMYPHRARPVLGTFVRDQVAALAARHEIQVLSPVPWMPVELPRTRYAGFARLPLETTEQRAGARWKVFRPRYPIIPKLLEGLEPLSILVASRARRSLLQRPDVVHAHSVLTDGLAASMLAEAFDVPLVITCHGFYRLGRSRRCLARRVLERASSVVYVGRALEPMLDRFAVPMQKRIRIGNGSNGAEVSAPQPPPTTLQAFVGGRFLLVTVAHLIRRKGHREVLDALASLVRRGADDFCYVVIGDGPERSALEAHARRLGLSSQVRFEGAVEHERLWAYFDAADLFVLPSWDEAFGVVYVEALSRGCPVIGCWGGGAEEILGSSGAGLLVPPRDSAALAEALLCARSSHSELRAAARARDIRALSWAGISEQLEATYDRTLRERSSEST